jgi:hypothetical protein
MMTVHGQAPWPVVITILLGGSEESRGGTAASGAEGEAVESQVSPKPCMYYCTIVLL